MIAAIYARKSTEQIGVSDEEKSVTRQIQHARAHAERKGWTVADDHVYVDDGISGAEFANRPGFLRLMNALKARINTLRKAALAPIPAALREAALAALDGGDWLGFLIKANNEDGLRLVFSHIAPLQARDCYEPALLHAFTGTRVNNHRYPVAELEILFGLADRDRLRAAGDPLPGPGPFVLYRGVAGRGRARRIRGLSWTASAERARWFANRYAATRPDSDPAVFRVTIQAHDVLAYSNERNEQEFIVLLPASVRPVRIERINPSKGEGI